MKTVTGGVGTIKRKREIRELLEQQDVNYEDDIFDATPFKRKKDLKVSNRFITDSCLSRWTCAPPAYFERWSESVYGDNSRLENGTVLTCTRGVPEVDIASNVGYYCFHALPTRPMRQSSIFSRQ